MYSWNETLHVSNSSSVHHQEFLLYTQQCYMSYRSADSLRAQAGMKAVPSWSCRVCIIKPNRCTNFSDLFLELNSTTLQDQDGTAVPSWSCSQAVSKTVWHIPVLCVQWKTPDNGQRNCPIHVEFHSKNRFEKLVHLVSFIITNTGTVTNVGMMAVTSI